MRKAQELSLNLIVVGVIALIVLLIVGGILIYGSQALDDIEELSPDELEIRLVSLSQSCQNKCGSLGLLLDWDDISSGSATETQLEQLKVFCCEAVDIDGSNTFDANGQYGPELCSLYYDECDLDGRSPENFCTGNNYDFTSPEVIGDGRQGCDIN